MAERVRVKAWGAHGLHVRAPHYLRGRTGVIERPLGQHANPEKLAYHLPAEKRTLYRVRFTMAEIWGEAAENPADTIDAEIYEHWLEPADAP
jgi:nitrile hydratase subunit beta